jgi:hypothetical protein
MSNVRRVVGRASKVFNLVLFARPRWTAFAKACLDMLIHDEQLSDVVTRQFKEFYRFVEVGSRAL